MDLEKILCETGLGDKEAKIYVALLRLGDAPPARIAEESGLKRSTVHSVLSQLVSRSLVESTPAGRSTVYRAVTPYAILQNHQKAGTMLEASIPDLLSLNDRYLQAPRIEMHFGNDGIRRVWDDCLEAESDIVYWVDDDWSNYFADFFPSVQDSDKSRFQEFRSEHIRQRVERGIFLRGLVPYETDTRRLKDKQQTAAQQFFLDQQKLGKKELREWRFIPRGRFPLKNEFTIYSDKIAVISYRDAVGVIIQNETYASTLRSVFDMAFEFAKMTESDTLSDRDKEYLGY